MRPAEVLGLQTGCCPDVASGQHLIYGREFKNAFDEDGNHHSTGRLREVPWVAIPPVVRTIRVREKIAPAEGLLLDAATHTFVNTPRPARPPCAIRGCAGALRPSSHGPPAWPRALDAKVRSSPTISTARSV